MNQAIVLAGGKSTRMKSATTKVMHNLIDQPVLQYIFDELMPLGLNQIVLVVNEENKQQLQTKFGETCTYCVQPAQLGTANAVYAAKEELENKKGQTLILMGDCPMFGADVFAQLLEKNKTADLTMLTAFANPPNSYGKLVRNAKLQPEKIVEEQFASPSQKNITEVNAGVYCVQNEILWQFLPYVNSERCGYRFTDMVELLVKSGKRVQTVALQNQEFVGINTRLELVSAQKNLTEKINKKHLENGVTIFNPSSVVIGSHVVMESDVTIYPNNVILGTSHIKSGTQVLPNCFLLNATVGENCVVESSKLENSSIGNHCQVGPFANIKQNTLVGDHCRLGAFVEVKNSQLGNQVKAAHLTYLGDATIEDEVNIGCGVVTVNYDGGTKNLTFIGHNSFIGSNVNLVAPITVGSHCVVAAGSTITQNVESGDMAIARNYQTNKPGYGKTYLDRVKSKKAKPATIIGEDSEELTKESKEPMEEKETPKPQP